MTRKKAAEATNRTILNDRIRTAYLNVNGVDPGIRSGENVPAGSDSAAYNSKKGASRRPRESRMRYNFIFVVHAK